MVRDDAGNQVILLDRSLLSASMAGSSWLGTTRKRQ
jgi:hypothetical protein